MSLEESLEELLASAATWAHVVYTPSDQKRQSQENTLGGWTAGPTVFFFAPSPSDGDGDGGEATFETVTDLSYRPGNDSVHDVVNEGGERSRPPARTVVFDIGHHFTVTDPVIFTCATYVERPVGEKTDHLPHTEAAAQAHGGGHSGHSDPSDSSQPRGFQVIIDRAFSFHAEAPLVIIGIHFRAPVRVTGPGPTYFLDCFFCEASLSSRCQQLLLMCPGKESHTQDRDFARRRDRLEQDGAAQNWDTLSAAAVNVGGDGTRVLLSNCDIYASVGGLGLMGRDHSILEMTDCSLVGTSFCWSAVNTEGSCSLVMRHVSISDVLCCGVVALENSTVLMDSCDIVRCGLVGLFAGNEATVQLSNTGVGMTSSGTNISVCCAASVSLVSCTITALLPAQPDEDAEEVDAFLALAQSSPQGHAKALRALFTVDHTTLVTIAERRTPSTNSGDALEGGGGGGPSDEALNTTFRMPLCSQSVVVTDRATLLATNCEFLCNVSNNGLVRYVNGEKDSEALLSADLYEEFDDLGDGEVSLDPDNRDTTATLTELDGLASSIRLPAVLDVARAHMQQQIRSRICASSFFNEIRHVSNVQHLMKCGYPQLVQSTSPCAAAFQSKEELRKYCAKRIPRQMEAVKEWNAAKGRSTAPRSSNNDNNDDGRDVRDGHREACGSSSAPGSAAERASSLARPVPAEPVTAEEILPAMQNCVLALGGHPALTSKGSYHVVGSQRAVLKLMGNIFSLVSTYGPNSPTTPPHEMPVNGERSSPAPTTIINFSLAHGSATEYAAPPLASFTARDSTSSQQRRASPREERVEARAAGETGEASTSPPLRDRANHYGGSLAEDSVSLVFSAGVPTIAVEMCEQAYPCAAVVVDAMPFRMLFNNWDNPIDPPQFLSLTAFVDGEQSLSEALCLPPHGVQLTTEENILRYEQGDCDDLGNITTDADSGSIFRGEDAPLEGTRVAIYRAPPMVNKSAFGLVIATPSPVLTPNLFPSSNCDGACHGIAQPHMHYRLASAVDAAAREMEREWCRRTDLSVSEAAPTPSCRSSPVHGLQRAHDFDSTTDDNSVPNVGAVDSSHTTATATATAAPSSPANTDAAGKGEDDSAVRGISAGSGSDSKRTTRSSRAFGNTFVNVHNPEIDVSQAAPQHIATRLTLFAAMNGLLTAAKEAYARMHLAPDEFEDAALAINDASAAQSVAASAVPAALQLSGQDLPQLPLPLDIPAMPLCDDAPPGLHSSLIPAVSSSQSATAASVTAKATATPGILSSSSSRDADADAPPRIRRSFLSGKTSDKSSLGWAPASTRAPSTPQRTRSNDSAPVGDQSSSLSTKATRERSQEDASEPGRRTTPEAQQRRSEEGTKLWVEEATKDRPSLTDLEMEDKMGGGQGEEVRGPPPPSSQPAAAAAAAAAGAATTAAQTQPPPRPEENEADRNGSADDDRHDDGSEDNASKSWQMVESPGSSTTAQSAQDTSQTSFSLGNLLHGGIAAGINLFEVRSGGGTSQGRAAGAPGVSGGGAFTAVAPLRQPQRHDSGSPDKGIDEEDGDSPIPGWTFRTDNINSSSDGTANAGDVRDGGQECSHPAPPSSNGEGDEAQDRGTSGEGGIDSSSSVDKSEHKTTPNSDTGRSETSSASEATREGEDHQRAEEVNEVTDDAFSAQSETPTNMSSVIARLMQPIGAKRSSDDEATDSRPLTGAFSELDTASAIEGRRFRAVPPIPNPPLPGSTAQSQQQQQQPHWHAITPEEDAAARHGFTDAALDLSPFSSNHKDGSPSSTRCPATADTEVASPIPDTQAMLLMLQQEILELRRMMLQQQQHQQQEQQHQAASPDPSQRTAVHAAATAALANTQKPSSAKTAGAAGATSSLSGSTLSIPGGGDNGAEDSRVSGVAVGRRLRLDAAGQEQPQQARGTGKLPHESVGVPTTPAEMPSSIHSDGDGTDRQSIDEPPSPNARPSAQLCPHQRRRRPEEQAGCVVANTVAGKLLLSKIRRESAAGTAGVGGEREEEEGAGAETGGRSATTGRAEEAQHQRRASAPRSPFSENPRRTGGRRSVSVQTQTPRTGTSSPRAKRGNREGSAASRPSNQANVVARLYPSSSISAMVRAAATRRGVERGGANASTRSASDEPYAAPDVTAVGPTEEERAARRWNLRVIRDLLRANLGPLEPSAETAWARHQQQLCGLSCAPQPPLASSLPLPPSSRGRRTPRRMSHPSGSAAPLQESASEVYAALSPYRPSSSIPSHASSLPRESARQYHGGRLFRPPSGGRVSPSPAPPYQPPLHARQPESDEGRYDPNIFLHPEPTMNPPSAPWAEDIASPERRRNNNQLSQPPPPQTTLYTGVSSMATTATTSSSGLPERVETTAMPDSTYPHPHQLPQVLRYHFYDTATTRPRSGGTAPGEAATMGRETMYEWYEDDDHHLGYPSAAASYPAGSEQQQRQRSSRRRRGGSGQRQDSPALPPAPVSGARLHIEHQQALHARTAWDDIVAEQREYERGRRQLSPRQLDAQVNRLYTRPMLDQMHRELTREERERRELLALQGCTFHPDINPPQRSTSGKRQGKGRRTRKGRSRTASAKGHSAEPKKKKAVAPSVPARAHPRPPADPRRMAEKTLPRSEGEPTHTVSRWTPYSSHSMERAGGVRSNSNSHSDSGGGAEDRGTGHFPSLPFHDPPDTQLSPQQPRRGGHSPTPSNSSSSSSFASGADSPTRSHPQQPQELQERRQELSPQGSGGHDPQAPPAMSVELLHTATHRDSATSAPRTTTTTTTSGLASAAAAGGRSTSGRRRLVLTSQRG